MYAKLTAFAAAAVLISWAGVRVFMDQPLLSQSSRSVGQASGPQITVGNLGTKLLFDAWGSPMARIMKKQQRISELIPRYMKAGGNPNRIRPIADKAGKYGDAGDMVNAERAMDELLAVLEEGQRGEEGRRPENLSSGLVEPHRKEREDFLKTVEKFNLTGVEDYLGWGVVEPSEGAWQWNIYKEDARAIKNKGLKFIPFVWVQNLPTWVRNNRSYSFASNVETGLETEALSIFAPQTRAAYDRFYRELQRQLGSEIDFLRIGSPYDYGETAYPAGAAKQVFPLKNLRSGFWVNEKEARQHFKETMRRKYRSVAELNRAWGTSFATFEALDYPRDNRKARHWLDFVRWYHEGFTEKMGELVDVVRRHFPSTPLTLNLGWPFEKVNLGQDITGLIKMMADKKVYPRTPTGMAVSFLYTKRVSTAVRHYQPPGLSSEPAADTTCEELALSFFKDLTTGVSWHFDYPPNLNKCQDALAQFRSLYKQGRQPMVDVALLYPTSSHFLENWNSWRVDERKDLFAGGFPAGLKDYAEELRDVVDFDVIDERLIEDKALPHYRIVIWPFGTTLEATTLMRIRDYVSKGGTLLVPELERCRTVEGDRGALRDLINLPQENGVRRVEKGYIIETRGDARKINTILAGAGDTRNVRGQYPGRLAPAPVVDNEVDDLLTSVFEDGFLVFNRGKRQMRKNLPASRRDARTPGYRNTPESINVPPMGIRWVDGQSGRVR